MARAASEAYEKPVVIAVLLVEGGEGLSATDHPDAFPSSSDGAKVINVSAVGPYTPLVWMYGNPKPLYVYAEEAGDVPKTTDCTAIGPAGGGSIVYDPAAKIRLNPNSVSEDGTMSI